VISTPKVAVTVLVVPTNEEIIVARETSRTMRLHDAPVGLVTPERG
jgi:acetate kinase